MSVQVGGGWVGGGVILIHVIALLAGTPAATQQFYQRAWTEPSLQGRWGPWRTFARRITSPALPASSAPPGTITTTPLRSQRWEESSVLIDPALL